MNEPELENQPKESFPQQAAKFSAYSPICVLFLIVLFAVIRGDKFLLGILNTALAFCGLIAAILALLSIPRVGKKGILGYALVGIVLNGLLVAMVIHSFMLIRDIAARQQQTMPREEAVSFPPVFNNSETVYNKALGYSFEIPEGFSRLPNTQASMQYSFAKLNADSTPLVFNIEHLKGRIPPKKIPFEILKSRSPFPIDAKLEEISADWQGFKLHGIRVAHNSTAGPVVLYIIEIPLSKRAIQLIVGGSADYDSENHKYFEKILSSFHGESNWIKASP